jgi:hypothetical protein
MPVRPDEMRARGGDFARLIFMGEAPLERVRTGDCARLDLALAGEVRDEPPPRSTCIDEMVVVALRGH